MIALGCLVSSQNACGFWHNGSTLHLINTIFGIMSVFGFFGGNLLGLVACKIASSSSTAEFLLHVEFVFYSETGKCSWIACLGSCPWGK